MEGRGIQRGGRWRGEAIGGEADGNIQMSMALCEVQMYNRVSGLGLNVPVMIPCVCLCTTKKCAEHEPFLIVAGSM